MDYEAYRRKNFRDPIPNPKFEFRGTFGVTLYYEDYEEATTYYQEVLGPPAYVEGSGTKGWQIGSGWLTLLRGKQGSPSNLEVGIEMESAAQAEALQAAFIKAGAKGLEPSDQLMYWPVRSCPVTDPFGTEILIFSKLSTNA